MADRHSVAMTRARPGILAAAVAVAGLLGGTGLSVGQDSVLEVEPDARGKHRQLFREKKARPEVVLGAGRYRVEVRYPKPDGPARASSEVEIREGERTEQTLNLHAGVLALSAVLREGAGPLKKESWYAIFLSGAPGRERDKLWKEKRLKARSGP